MVHCDIGLKVEGQLYDRVRLQGLSHQFDFLFLSLYLWSWTKSQTVLENPMTNSFAKSIKFLDWLFLVI